MVVTYQYWIELNIFTRKFPTHQQAMSRPEMPFPASQWDRPSLLITVRICIHL